MTARSRIHARGTFRYKVTADGPHYDLRVWCDCPLASDARHWHLLSQHRSVGEAERGIDLDQAARRLVSP